MGMIYRVKCERCGVEFEHSVGVGFAYACVGCGEMADEGAPFWCPCCNLRHDPTAEGFSDRLTEVVMWD